MTVHKSIGEWRVANGVNQVGWNVIGARPGPQDQSQQAGRGY